MSKIVSAERHDEVMEKLDTLACQLHHLGNATKSIGKTILANSTQPESPAFWEAQCREKDATLTEVLRKLQAAEEGLAQTARLADKQIADLQSKLKAAETEVIRLREDFAILTNEFRGAMSVNDTTYMGVRIDCEATRAALDAIIKDFLSRPKVKA